MKWWVGRVPIQSPGHPESQNLQYLDVKSREVAEQLCVIGKVRAAAGRAHHVSDVLLLQGDGEVLTETVRTDGAFTRSQSLHLEGERGEKGVRSHSCQPEEGDIVRCSLRNHQLTTGQG